MRNHHLGKPSYRVDAAGDFEAQHRPKSGLLGFGNRVPG
jgi:hypothetical protein